MISYEGVIRKRLRLKRHPEIPPYKPPVQNDDPVHADNPEEHPSSEHTHQDHQQHQHHHHDEDDDEITPVTNSQHDQSSSSSTPVPTDSADRADTRTDAERRHDQVVLLREEQRLRKEASKSYREKVDVRLVSFYRFYYHYSDGRLPFFVSSLLD